MGDLDTEEVSGSLRRPWSVLAPAVGSGLMLGLGLIAGTTVRGLRHRIGSSGVLQAYDSPQYRDGAFHNRLPSRVLEPAQQATFLRDWLRKPAGVPTGPVPLVEPHFPVRADTLAATWLGHACVLIEIGGHRVLTDPVWSDRVSPSPMVGPRRLHPVPLALAELPPLTAVVISHDHYDHLDTATVETLTRTQSAPFVVPLGIGSHLRAWGVPADRIVELDWHDVHRIGDLDLVCTPARHFSGRGLVRDRTLWASWVVRVGDAAVFFGGDTGASPAFAEIGATHGPFQLTILPIGAYDHRWPDVHLDPEEAVMTHRDLRGDLLLPIHWATFDLAFHPWAEPPQRLLAAAATAGVTVTTPRPGERITVADPPPPHDWWSPIAARPVGTAPYSGAHDDTSVPDP